MPVMSHEKVYQNISEALKKAGGAIPVIPNDEFFLLLKDLVTPEEADIAASLSNKPITAEDLAKNLDRPIEDVRSKLEAMTDSGFLHAKKSKEGRYKYNLMPLLPGVFEAQFIRGTKTERDYRIAHRFKDYLEVMNKLRDSLPKGPQTPSTPYFRVLPVQEEIDTSKTVLPYAQLTKFVKQTEAIAVGTCFCRHHAILLDENNDCGVSHKNCMAFGDGAIFLSERHNGRLLKKDEALEILKKAEEDGLVHCSANTSDELGFICNCCSCHCGILRMAKAAPKASLLLTSGYIAHFDAELCTACETCTERCPVLAISVNGTASVDDLQCIGCGLCVSTCPTEAIALVPKPDMTAPPKKFRDLEAAMKSN
jgi:Na+-translocating ferredoxin:NAD+ oxidoreductase subunit B